MELAAERLSVFRDDWLLRPVYAHQRFLLHESGFQKLKVHIPTAGGKTLGAVLFHGKRASSAWKPKELRQVGNAPPGPFAFDFHRAFARISA